MKEHTPHHFSSLARAHKMVSGRFDYGMFAHDGQGNIYDMTTDGPILIYRLSDGAVPIVDFDIDDPENVYHIAKPYHHPMPTPKTCLLPRNVVFYMQGALHVGSVTAPTMGYTYNMYAGQYVRGQIRPVLRVPSVDMAKTLVCDQISELADQLYAIGQSFQIFDEGTLRPAPMAWQRGGLEALVRHCINAEPLPF